MTIQFTGSCIAVYPLHFADDVLGAVKELRELDYSDRQLMVIGEWSLLKEGESGDFPLFNEFKSVGLRDVFWDELGDLLQGKVSFHMPDSGSLTVAGGVSNSVFNTTKSETDTVEKLKNKIESSNEQKSEKYIEWDWLFDLLGIPESSFRYYKTTLETGLIILIAFGDHKEVEDAGNLLELSRSIDVSLHLSNLN